MQPLIYEFLGTTLLLLLGNGVVANVLLPKSKGKDGGWIVISFGWAMAVFLGVYVSADGSGGHLNPAVSFTMAYLGRLPWDQVPGYVLAQVAGGVAGSILNWLLYKKHFDLETNPDLIRATFCTAPAIRSGFWNFMSETIATFAFMLGVLYIASPASNMGSLNALPVALLVLGIGVSLGGSTGYAINPARDLGPRIAHFILPIPSKTHSDWKYAWVPILGPLVGGALATLVYYLLLGV